MCGSLVAQFPADHPQTACARSQQKEVAKVGQFIFATYKNEKTGDACLQVFRDGKVIFKRSIGNDGYYQIGQRDDKSHPNTVSITNGTDITGRGHPDMIVSFYSGGAHCCLSYDVFELEPTFRLVATLDAQDGDSASFRRIGGQYYFVANDWTFAYWLGSFAGSPAPKVILGFVNDDKGGGYHLALDQMKQSPPTAREWGNEVANVRGDFVEGGDRTGSDLWRNMLTLIYIGNDELAWRLFDETWPKNMKGKETSLADFCSRLKTSPY